MYQTKWARIMEWLGIEVEEASGDRVVATMPVDARNHQPFGILHGGASVVLAETACSIGALFHAPQDHIAVGMEINANHIRPVSSGLVRAVATPAHVGRKSTVWEIRITNEDDQLVCLSRCTLAFIPNPS